MIPFVLFLATAVSGFLLTQSWAGGGIATAGPADQAIGYAGAVVLMLAAYVSAFSLWAGRYIAGLGVALVAAYCLCENVGVPPRMFNVEVVCSLLLLAGTVFYIVGSFRVYGGPNVLYPRQASKGGKAVIAVFIAMQVSGFGWWAFWHNATREQLETVRTRWEPVMLQQVTSGRHQVKFTAQDSSITVTVASDDIYEKLQAAKTKLVDVVVKKTFKHGTLVALSVESIDGSENFSLLDLQPAKFSP